MKNNKLIIWGVAGLILIAIIVGFILKGSSADKDLRNQEISMDDPVDIVLDFYRSWLDAKKSTDTDPYAAGLADAPILSEELRVQLANIQNDPENKIDPVLCQLTTPENIRTRPVLTLEDKIQILVLAKDQTLTGQATVDLSRLRDGWYIKNITCSLGESDIPREFSFDRTGNLLKSVPPPLDPQYWHLVFEENGQNGHTAPLFFDAKSTCIALDGSETVCDPSTFADTMKASVQGEMTESGVSVLKLRLLE